MSTSRGSKAMIFLIAAILGFGALHLADAVFAPLALALFIMALIWPLQRRLAARLPGMLALTISIVVMLAVVLLFISLVAWSFGRVGHSFVADAARYQGLYDQAVAWLDSHGVEIGGLWAEHFNVQWVVRSAGQVAGRINTTLTFGIIAAVYVMLGLLEVDDMHRRILALNNKEASRVLLDGIGQTALKLRKYMVVRTWMSLVTGLLVWALAAASGLEFAAEWGVVAFVLNYIPFMGPFVATLFPTLFAMAQFGSWQGVFLIFIGFNLIQFAVGSYVEPRVAGNALSMSPFIVLFSVFFWAAVWGVFGAFIGVPITIAVLTFCAQHPSSRWISDLVGGAAQMERQTP
ncbi:MAG: AI-2E family transporter [Hyphomicrobiales bacterium]|nr:AI-2E family transporter [Hyphomicrobiales bacterium]